MTNQVTPRCRSCGGSGWVRESGCPRCNPAGEWRAIPGTEKPTKPTTRPLTLPDLYRMAEEISVAKGLEERSAGSGFVDLFDEVRELYKGFRKMNYDPTDKDSVPNEIADVIFVAINIARKAGLSPEQIGEALRFKWGLYGGEG